MIDTEHLVLRPFVESDFADVLSIYQHPLVCRYERDIPTEKETREKFDLILQDQTTEPRARYRLGVTIRPDDRIRGYVHSRLEFADIRQWEIGWTMHPDFWGRGYATEAARAMLAFCFTRLGAHRVTAFCRADNAASERIMRKLGMRKEAHMQETVWLDNQWWDELLYAILDRDWKERPD